MRSLLIPSVVVSSIAARFKLPPEAKWYELILRATASVLSHCMGDICFGLWKHPYFSPGIIVDDFFNFFFSCVKLVVLWINCIKQWYLWWKKILKVHKERTLEPRQYFTRKKRIFLQRKTTSWMNSEVYSNLPSFALSSHETHETGQIPTQLTVRIRDQRKLGYVLCRNCF